MTNSDKAELYRRIVQQTDERTLLGRMRVHGFWPANQGLPDDRPAEARERANIEAEMARLRSQYAVIRDPDKALNVERKRRWEESKKRRAERKAERAREAEHRRKEYDAFRKANLVHAGAGVSGGLQERTSDVAALQRRQLPVLHDGPDVARAMGIALSSLLWLTYHRKSATVVHYRRYSIAKKTGGLRHISAPRPALKKAQQWVQENILARLEVTSQAHGF